MGRDMKKNMLIVFDFDGTVADTSEDLYIATNHIRGMYGLPNLSRERVIALVGRGAHALASDVVEKPMVHEHTLKALEEFRSFYGKHQADNVRLYPTVRETIEELSRVNSLAVLSNKPGPMVRRLAGHLGVDGFFDPLWGSDDVDFLKPDPAGLKAVMAANCTPAHRTIMVGDQPIDIETGTRAGVKTVFCEYGFRTGQGFGDRAHFTINEMSGLIGVLESFEQALSS